MIWFLFLFNFLAKLTFSRTHCLSPGCLSSHSSIPNCILHLIENLIYCRSRKVIFFWPAFFLPTFFRWLLHTFLPRFPYFFCHVRKKKIFFTTFLSTANTINHVLPTRVPVLHMFRFPSSSDSATPTTNFWIPTIQLIPRHLANSVHNFCPTTNFQTATTVTATCYSTGKHTKL